MQKAKGTVAARKHSSKIMKAYYSDPVNRQKRSMALKGHFHTPAPVTSLLVDMVELHTHLIFVPPQMQVWNSTAKTVDVKGTGDTTVQNSRIAWLIGDSRVGSAGGKATTEEHVES